MKTIPVKLSDCADAALQTLQLRIEETGAEISSDSLPEIVGDPTMLAQLYQNLVGNALKFVADKKPTIRLTAERQGQQWLLGVRDNGIGLKGEHADRIFKPFQRLHSRSEYSGTGIGLAICSKTVQRHGGEIHVESEPGAGAHFKFTLFALGGSGEQQCEVERESEKELLFC